MKATVDPEAKIREAFTRGALQDAATLAMHAYGPEVMRFLRARLGSRTLAEDAYLQFAEDFWTSFHSFQWRCRVRVWLFILARSAATRLVKRAHYKSERTSAHAGGSYWNAVQDVRTATAAYLQTTVKDRMRALREQLDDDDQALLILRVDRGLDYNELALIIGEVSDSASEVEVVRAAARLRARFRAATKKLQALAVRDGLLDP